MVPEMDPEVVCAFTGKEKVSKKTLAANKATLVAAHARGAES
jgi:hypothetical protein